MKNVLPVLLCWLSVLSWSGTATAAPSPTHGRPDKKADDCCCGLGGVQGQRACPHCETKNECVPDETHAAVEKYLQAYEHRSLQAVLNSLGPSLRADKSFVQGVVQSLKDHSSKRIKANIYPPQINGGVVVVRVDVEWRQVDTKTGKPALVSLKRTLRLVKASSSWKLVSDKDAVEDLADEIATRGLDRENVPIDKALLTETLVDALVQRGLNAENAGDYWRAERVFVWGARVATHCSKTAVAKAEFWLANSSLRDAEQEEMTGHQQIARLSFEIAIDAYRLCLSLQTDQPTDQQRVAALSQLGRAYEGHGDFKKALEYRQKARAAADTPSLIAETLFAVAALTSRADGPEKGRAVIKDYLDKCRSGDDTMRADVALDQLAHYDLNHENVMSAVSEYQEVFKHKEKAGEPHSIAASLSNLAVAYYEQGDYASAKRHLEEARDLLERVNDDAARSGLGDVLPYLSGLLYHMGQFKQSLACANSALPLESYFNEEQKARLYNILSANEQVSGDLKSAYVAAVAAVGYARRCQDWTGMADAILKLADVQTEQGNYVQALDLIKFIQRVSNTSLSSKADYIKVKADILFSQGNAQKAREGYEQAHDLYGQINNTYGAALSEIGMGHCWLKVDRAKAKECFEKAFQFAVNTNRDDVLWGASLGLARTLLEEGRPSDALARLQTVLDQGERVPIRERTQCLSDKARVLFRMDRLPEAAGACQEAITCIETMRSQVAGGPVVQQEFFRQKQSPYQLLTQILLRQEATKPAFQSAEQAKARAVRDALDRQKIPTFNIPSELLRTRHLLSDHLAAINRKISRSQRQGETVAAISELEEARQETRSSVLSWQSLEEIVSAGEAILPRSNKKLSSSPALTASEAMGMLPDTNTAFLEYVIVDQQVYLFVMTKGDNRNGGGLKCYPIPSSAAVLSSDVQKFREKIVNTDLDFRDLGRKLYRDLLAPAAQQLRGKSRLCVVPDGFLWNLPFQALMVGDNHYVLDDHVLFYAPSLTALRQMEEMSRLHLRSPSGQAVEAFANPVLPWKSASFVAHLDHSMGASPVTSTDGPFPTLPPVGQLFQEPRLPGKGGVYMGVHATEANVKAHAESGSELIFWTHSIFDDQNPFFSYLLLAAKPGDGEDGRFEAWEVLRMRLKADLVVLPACNTASGQVSQGEGLIGLTWAFTLAGCPRIIASQLPVSSDSTAILVSAFQKNIQRAKRSPGAPFGPFGAAQALHDAARKLRNSHIYGHPFYWSSFILVGDGDLGNKESAQPRGTDTRPRGLVRTDTGHRYH